MSLPGNIGLLARMPTPPSSQYGDVDGPSSATNNAVVIWDGTTGKLIKNSTATYDGTTFVLPNTATGGFALYNSADQVTNYERAALYWATNVFEISSRQVGGSGVIRPINIRGAVGNIYLDNINTTGQIQLSGSSTSNTAAIGIRGNNFISTATSGTIVYTSLTPTYNQASGTAANTDLLINRTETAVGSGAQNLIDAQVGSTSHFRVGSRGALIQSVQALSGAGAVNVTQEHTDYTSTGGAQALTLADGTVGQTKTIVHVVDGGSGVLTPTTKIGFTTITFTNVGDSVTLRYTAAGWAIVGIFGAVAA